MRASRGFNLIELCMAMFIILCGFLVVAKVNPMGYQGAAVTRDRLLALRVARSVMDQARALPFNVPAKYAALERPVLISGELAEGAQTGLEFAVTDVNVTVPATIPGAPPPSYGNVTVRVEWRDPAGSKDAEGKKSLVLTGGIVREP